MERITNDIDLLRNEAKLEIEQLDLKPQEKVIAYFSVFPSIGDFPYKITLIQQVDGAIYSYFRKWDAAYNFTHWDRGIYNLDRLRIISEKKILSESNTTTLKVWLMDLQRFELPESIKNTQGIVLDGCEYTFGISHGIHQVDYQWKIATDDIKLFAPFIELMQQQHEAHNLS